MAPNIRYIIHKEGSLDVLAASWYVPPSYVVIFPRLKDHPSTWDKNLIVRTIVFLLVLFFFLC